jgi:hypothetical protein
MAPEIANALPTVVVALIAAIAGVVVAILNRRGNRENALIDQLQEQLGSVEKRVDESLRRERIRDDYIHELRDHIDQRKPPPPPPWPEGLTR